MTGNHNSWLCGWLVTSELPLPDLMPWTADNRPADVEIRLGNVPGQLPNATSFGPLLQIAPNGTCRFAVPGVAAYLIENARTVTIAPETDPNTAEIRVFLLGTVFGILCHQKGLLPLHASCVQIDDGSAVAFCGASGAGKSTMAAAFQRHGYPVLADDISVVDLSSPEGPLVQPAFPRIKLWRDAIDSFALSTTGLERSRPTLEKFHLRTHETFTTEPTRLSAVYHLRDTRDGGQEGVEELRGLTAVRDLFSNVYRRRIGQNLTGSDEIFKAVGRLCEAVPVLRLHRKREFAEIGSIVETLAARHAGVCV